MRTVLVEDDRNVARCRKAGRQRQGRQDDYLIKSYDVRDMLARIRPGLPVGMLNR
jgi:hypothetical protein